MKMHLLLPCLLIGCAAPFLVFQSSADPILGYQQPIAQQLTTDLGSGTGDANTLNRALAIFHRLSRSLSGDLGILRDLNGILVGDANYRPLLSDAANAYLSDFQGRRDELAEQLRPAPKTATKTSAQILLRKLDTALSNAVVAADTTDRIKHLQNAAVRIPQTSNTIQRAVRAPVGLSSMTARIGALRFVATRGFVGGGPVFQSETGVTVGEFNPTNDCHCLAVSATDNGNVVRNILLYISNVEPTAPATYSLGGGNVAFYRATDRSNNREYDFQSDATLSNGLVTNAFVTIDFIGTNYLLGRFAFIGTNAPFLARDTNTTASIYNGEFQLNFRH